jgi:hypothetical protein
MHRVLSISIMYIPNLQRIQELEEDSNNKWKGAAGVVTYEGRIYQPNHNLLRHQVIWLFLTNPESCYLGALITTWLASQDFYRPTTDFTLRKYTAKCKPCHWIQVPGHTWHDTNLPLMQLSTPCHGVTMGFGTNLPWSTICRWMVFLVVSINLHI